MNYQDTLKNIQALESKLNLKNPHRNSEIAVEISILLGNLSDDLSELENIYSEHREEVYKNNLERMKPTPARQSLEFDSTLRLMRNEINQLKEFIRTRESLVRRIENHLRNVGDMERRGV